MSSNNTGQSDKNAIKRRLFNDKKKLLAPVVAAVMLGAIFAPLQSADAFVLDVDIAEEIHKAETRTIPFSISLEIPPGEFVSMSNITLAFDEGTTAEKIFTFDSDGHRISGVPVALVSDLEVTISPDTAVGQGYAYGYGLVSSGPAGSGSPVTSSSIGYGAATSFGAGFIGPATITLEGTLRTALLVREGTLPVTHTIRASIDTGAADSNQHILSDTETFIVYPVVTRSPVTAIATAGDLTAESRGYIFAKSINPSSQDDEEDDSELSISRGDSDERRQQKDNDSEMKYKFHAVVMAVITDEDGMPKDGEYYAFRVQAVNTDDGSTVDLGIKEGIMKNKKTLSFTESWESDTFGPYFIRTALAN